MFCLVFAANKKNIFLTPSIFSSSSFFSKVISTLLTSPIIPSLLSQHPSPYSFYLNAYMYRMSLEPPTFGFPLDLCPDALPLSHGDFDASSTIFFNYIYSSSNKFPSIIQIRHTYKREYTTRYYTTVHVTCTSALTIYKLTVL